MPHLQAHGSGRIVNLTSITVKEPHEGLVLSNTLRPAVHGLSKSLVRGQQLPGSLLERIERRLFAFHEVGVKARRSTNGLASVVDNEVETVESVVEMAGKRLDAGCVA